MPISLHAVLAFLLCALPLGSLAAAQGANLFEPALPADMGASARADAGAAVARQRLVRLSAATLDEVLGESADDRAAMRPPSGSLRIELFPDKVGTFDRDGLEPAFGGGSIWTGHLANGAKGAATLVVDGRQITGHVSIGGRIYRIEPIEGAVHRIVEIRASRLPPPGPPLRPPMPLDDRTSSPAPEAARAKGTTTIDVLFAYTDRAQKASSNIKSDINLAVSLSNEAYKKSMVSIALHLVGTILVGAYDENKFSYDGTLNNVTDIPGSGSTSSGRAAFDATRKKRNSVGADLVVLLREDGEYCGLAWVVDKPSASTSDFGFSEVTRSCISTYATAHEMGHNMGLLHDRYVEDPAPASRYNFGYVNVGKEVLDIMAYASKCSQAGEFCEKINKFSNPDIKVSNAPFGIPKGKSGAADASRRLNETRAGIASYRGSKGSGRDVAADGKIAVGETRDAAAAP